MTTHAAPIRTPPSTLAPDLDPMRQNITDRWLRSVKVETRTDFVDTLLRDFGVRVSPDGRKTFWVRYRHNGHRYRQKLGTYPIVDLADARERAQAKLRAVQRGDDPLIAGLRFGELAALYLSHIETRLKPKTIYSVRRSFERDCLPAWREVYFASLDIAAVRSLLRSVPKSGNADKLRSYLSGLWTWAIGEGLTDRHPVRLVRRNYRSKPRERVLSDTEIATLWEHWESVYRTGRSDGKVTRTLFQVLLLTGLRMGEAMGGKLSEIDGRWWTIPGARMKNSRPHAVYVTDTLQALIDRLAPWRARSPWIFPSRDYSKPLADTKRSYQRDSELSEVTFSPHVLRHTFVTGLSRIGIAEHIKQRCVAHIPRNVTSQFYDHHTYAAEKRDAWQRWEDHVLTVTGHRSTPPLPADQKPPALDPA